VSKFFGQSRIALVIGVWLATSPVLAQSWPTRPVTMVIPFAAGGGTDATGRILAPRLSELLGQQVIVENVGGAGGMTGSNRVAKAAPDGYQFLFANTGTAALQSWTAKADVGIRLSAAISKTRMLTSHEDELLLVQFFTSSQRDKEISRFALEE
jgi:tripartite-type tricarboxylate transporter receptor subunit TctC